MIQLVSENKKYFYQPLLYLDNQKSNLLKLSEYIFYNKILIIMKKFLYILIGVIVLVGIVYIIVAPPIYPED